MEKYLCTLSEVFHLNFRQHVFWVPAISMWARILKADKQMTKYTVRLQWSNYYEQLENQLETIIQILKSTVTEQLS